MASRRSSRVKFARKAGFVPLLETDAEKSVGGRAAAAPAPAETGLPLEPARVGYPKGSNVISSVPLSSDGAGIASAARSSNSAAVRPNAAASFNTLSDLGV